MAITAGSRVFIDTNILVYANLALSPYHDKAVACLREFEDVGLDLYIIPLCFQDGINPRPI